MESGILVAGVRNKDKDFWEGLEEWDIVVMIETWIDEKGWEKIRGRLPKGYKWSVQMAKRKNKKGRPSHAARDKRRNRGGGGRGGGDRR